VLELGPAGPSTNTRPTAPRRTPAGTTRRGTKRIGRRSTLTFATQRGRHRCVRVSRSAHIARTANVLTSCRTAALARCASSHAAAVAAPWCTGRHVQRPGRLHPEQFHAGALQAGGAHLTTSRAPPYSTCILRVFYVCSPTPRLNCPLELSARGTIAVFLPTGRRARARRTA
jgi:hypothetical protein